MYFKEEKILLAAIDHGFSSIKTPHFLFDNGVRKLGSATTLQENTLEYGNECYKTGEGRLPLKDDKTADKDFSDICSYSKGSTVLRTDGWQGAGCGNCSRTSIY